MATINTIKELAVTYRPILLATITFPDATVLRVASLAVTYPALGNAFAARIDEPEVERLAALSEQGIDRVPSATLRLADPDAYLWTTYERGHGFKGAVLELRFVLYDTITNTFTTDSLVPFIGICDTPGIDEKYLTVTAAPKLNLTKFMVPSVPIQQRCPWSNPTTAAQRALAADPLSRYYPCGETRDLTTAPPCAYTRASCTQPTHFAGVTWSPKSGAEEGKSYTAGKVSWRNVDTSAKYHEWWPLWLGGLCWMECRALNVVGDGNYTRGEIAVGVGAVGVQRVILNGVELSLGMTGDYRWHYVNQGTRAGTPNTDRPYNSLGDPYGGLTAIQVLAPRAVWSPDSEPNVRVLGGRKTLRAYRRIISAAGSGGNIVVTLDGPNEDCAGNSPFTVTIAGNTWAAINGTHGLTSWAWGPPGTITLTTTGSGSGTGGYLYYEVRGYPHIETDVPDPTSPGGASSPWFLLELLRQARFEFDEFDPYTWADAAKLCNAILSYTAEPRFTSSVAVRQRRSVAELARGLRQSIGGLLVPGSDGKLRLQIEGPLAEQQPAAVDGSNYDTPVSSKTRAGAATNGYVAYRFDESNSWGLKRAQQSLADQPNRVSFSFSDPAHDHAISTFAMVDSDDLERSDQEIPGGLQVEPEGIASYNHALRAAKLGLAKIHRGNPAGDTRGTDWWEWTTTFRGCKLAIGQIVAQNSTRYGLTNALVRLTEIRPTRNFENVTLRGHYHVDDWYLDSVGNVAEPAYSAHKHDRLARPAFPWAPDLQVPIAGDVIFGAERSFSVQPTYEIRPDGTALVRLLVGGKLPVNSFNALSAPGIALQATVATTGGTIPGGITLYIAIAAVDADGNLSGLSPAISRADVPAGTNTNTVTVAVNDWDASQTGYAVFAGMNPNQMSWQQDGSGKPSTVTMTYLVTGRYGPPDVEFDRLLLRIKRIDHSGVFGVQLSAVGTNALTVTGAAWTTNQWANYDCSILAKADGSAVPIANFTVSANTAAILTVTPDPATLGIAIGDVLVMRSRPTVGSDAGGHYIEDANWQNSLSNAGAGLVVNAEKSQILRIIAGPGRGQQYIIKSNTATRLYITGDWYTTPTTASRYVIEESAWQFEKRDGPYENSDPNFQTTIQLDAENWRNRTILIQAVALDGGDAMGLETLAPVRDMYVFGEPPSVRTVASNTTLLLSDQTLLVDASAGNVTVTLLPAAQYQGRSVTIKRVDSNPTAGLAYIVTITPAAGDTIGGEASIVLAVNGDFWELIANG